MEASDRKESMGMPVTQWSFGDKVVHAGKPEWGTGLVTAAAKTVHEGKPCQRLTIRFDRAGLKTISTAIADLREATTAAVAAEIPQTDEQAAWANGLAGGTPAEILARLPEAATDPFSSLADRLKATLNLYKFSDAAASLLDWAAVQSGLKDPLSRFNRHELEQMFKRYAFVRDEHLKKLAIEMRRKDPSGLDQMIRSALPQAQQALRRLDAKR
jgi:hypothetical protein